MTASREYKGGFLSKFKASLDSSHKKSFKVCGCGAVLCGLCRVCEAAAAWVGAKRAFM